LRVNEVYYQNEDVIPFSYVVDMMYIILTWVTPIGCIISNYVRRTSVILSRPTGLRKASLSSTGFTGSFSNASSL